MSVPRTKPWEVSSGTSAAASTAQSAATPAATPATASDPSLPARPTSLTSVAPVTSGYGGSGYSGYGSYGSGYGGGMYGNSMYGSGMYGSSMYGGYGSYGRYGGGMYGGGYGMGGMGMGMGPQDPNSLQQSTAATFQLIESIVGAVGGFAQMLESTYMATHSSFFAMMSVAEQFGHLKNSLGSILGIFAIMRWARRLLAKLTGQPATAASAGMTAKEFAKFNAAGGGAAGSRQRPSFKPLLMFLAAVFGFPYLLGKLIRSMAVRQEGQLVDGGQAPGGSVDPSSLEFCRAVHDFVPENPQVELELRKGDLVAILTKKDPMGNDSQWWKARTRDGRTGYIPSTYVEPVPRRIQEVKQIKDVEEQQQANALVEEFQSKLN